VTTLSNLIAGFDGRAVLFAGETRETWPGGNVKAEFEVREQALGDARTALPTPGDYSLLLPVSLVASGRNAAAWANLLEGATRGDWEAVDGELRQFLSGLGGLAEHTNESEVGRTWPLWIGMATALLMARRASSGRRRLFRRSVQEALWASSRRPVPVGPWPLGSL
jgi:hypothetical protein